MSFRNQFDHVPLLVFKKLPAQRPEFAEQPCLGPHGTPASATCGLSLGLTPPPPQHCFLWFLGLHACLSLF